MRLNLKKGFLLAVLAILIFAAGFLIGTRVGVNQFLIADAQYKASILASNLNILKPGKPNFITEDMEINLNDEIAKHGRYMESHLTWLFPHLIPQDNRAICRAVAYRLANPYEGPDWSKPETWNPGVDMNSEFAKGVIEGVQIQKRYLQNVLVYYGDKAHNCFLKPTPQTSAAERGR